MPGKTSIALIAISATLSIISPATAGPGGAAAAAKRGVVHPSPEVQSGFAESAFDDIAMMANAEKLIVSYDYSAMLAFARCVSRFDPQAAGRVMEDPIGSVEESTELTRLAEVNHACLVQRSKVHPLLLRAALAEAAMESGEVRQPMANAVGVPAIAKGVRLGAISLCQNSRSRDLVTAVLATAPGSSEERAAVERLYGSSSDCGPSALGGISPTVARLSLVDTRYRVAARTR